MPALLLFAVIAVAALVVLQQSAYADPLRDAFRQRIGNYDVEMTTDPKSPVAGSRASVMIRIAGVNGDDLVDVPIVIRVVKDGAELERTNPIVVPYGHFTYQYTFAETGRYVLYVDLNDYSYSGQTLTFTFFVNVAGAYDNYLYVAAPAGIGVAGAAAGAIIFMKKRKQRRMDMTDLR